MSQSDKITRTVVLVLNDTNMLSLAAAVDPMRAANRQAGRRLFDWEFATPGARDVRLTSGITIPAAPLHRVEACDVLVVVAGFDLEAQSTPQLRASLRRLAQPSTIVAGIDGGPWIMADAGLLDQKEATTHWEDLDSFAARFTSVVTRNARFVSSGSRLTSGGAAPAIDMMLSLIKRFHGTGLAEKVAGSFIYDSGEKPERPQRDPSPHHPHSAVTARAHRLMVDHIEDPIALSEIAVRLAISPRALQMQFQDALGRSPRAYYLELRLSEADRLVTQTQTPLQDVALSTGFLSQSSFARAYRRHFNTSARRRRQLVRQ